MVQSLKDKYFRVCEDCGRYIGFRHGNAHFCSDCAEFHIMLRNRLRHRGLRLGTGLLGMHRNPRFDKEFLLVEQEKKRLGLK